MVGKGRVLLLFSFVFLATSMCFADSKKGTESEAKLLLERDPILTILNMIIKYNINRPTEPINPNSSENKVKIKSVCFSGKKSK